MNAVFADAKSAADTRAEAVERQVALVAGQNLEPASASAGFALLGLLRAAAHPSSPHPKRKVSSMRFSLPGAGSALLAALFLAGCGAPHLRTVNDAKSELVGRDQAALRSCIGEPLATHETPGEPGSVWIYSSAQQSSLDGRRVAQPPAGHAAHEKACVFRFTIADGKIASVRSENRAGWGFGSITKCSELIRACTSS
ncbi:hypothetical protein [Afifella pfennigii]|uniref:hypothetical protein n=1 Tax=Afifella pfennigii TaxID=209897 RepID=UPI000689DA28|nr:hypothetical protein [Afifella pfennigii]